MTKIILGDDVTWASWNKILLSTHWKTDRTTSKLPFMYSYSGNCAASVLIFIDIYSCSRIGRSIVGMRKSLADTCGRNVEIGTMAAQFLFCEYLFRIFCIVSLQCAVSHRELCQAELKVTKSPHRWQWHQWGKAFHLMQINIFYRWADAFRYCWHSQVSMTRLRNARRCKYHRRAYVTVERAKVNYQICLNLRIYNILYRKLLLGCNQ